MSDQRDIDALYAEKEASDAENRKLRAVIKWALGECDDFPDHPPSVTLTGQPKYWWRKELLQRFTDAITVDVSEEKADALARKMSEACITMQAAINEYRGTK